MNGSRRVFRRRRGPAEPRNWERTFAVLAIVGSIALVTWAYLTRPETPEADPAPAASTTAHEDRPAAPTCREVLERTGKDPVGTCRAPSGTLLTIGPANRPLLVGPLTARVSDVTVTPASTPGGRAQDRARVAVEVTLLNHSEQTVEVDWTLIDLSVGRITVAPDRAAASLPGGWQIGALPAGARRRGQLRFETAGTVTRRLISTRRADLAIRVEDRRVGVIRLRLPSA